MFTVVCDPRGSHAVWATGRRGLLCEAGLAKPFCQAQGWRVAGEGGLRLWGLLLPCI